MALIENSATGLPVGDPDRLPLSAEQLPSQEALQAACSAMILSAAGWRKIFASPLPGDPRAPWAAPLAAPATMPGAVPADALTAAPDEDSLSARVAPVDLVLSCAMAQSFGECMLARSYESKSKAHGDNTLAAQGAAQPAGKVAAQRAAQVPVALLGIDSRPTGPAIADIFARILVAMGIEVRYLFIVAAPEIMAYAKQADGFAYISASHNPPAHNGVKFGASSGGVLPAESMHALLRRLRELIARPDYAQEAFELLSSADRRKLAAVYAQTTQWKRASLSAYTLFSHRVVSGLDALDEQQTFLDELAAASAAQPLGIVGDLNGSARCLAPDRDWLSGLKLRTHFLNDRLRQFAHRIVPEGESLDSCRSALEKMHAVDASYTLGYTPDCDGDRGNLVWYSARLSAARSLEAQEVFALACIAELACLARQGAQGPVAIAVNDATSMRIEAIAACFGATVFRAETGEANVVALAESLRREGWTVRIMGEGSNGGNITHPSMVRDPLATLGAVIKLLRLPDTPDRASPFRIWLRACGREAGFRPDFSLQDIVDSLPLWSSTSVFEPRAALHIASSDKIALKTRYHAVFTDSWKEKAQELRQRYGIRHWRAFASIGSRETEIGDDFGASGTGGLRIVLYCGDNPKEQKPVAFLWMRGSGTEPVFRVMVDIAGGTMDDERFLFDWHVAMVRKADRP